MIPVARLNHAVLFVRDASVAADFYARVFGFELVESIGERAVFMRAGGGENHHDLGLFSVGPQAPRPQRGSVGLYHLAWEVPTIEDLATAARELSEAGALGGASDHGVSKSLYGWTRTPTSSRSCGASPASSGATWRRGPGSSRWTWMPRSAAGEPPGRRLRNRRRASSRPV